MAFTDSEKARVKHFLGYPDWSQLSNGLQLGFPAGAQPLFLVEQAFQRLTPPAEESVRADLCQCEDIERQLGEARSRFKARKIGELELQEGETRMLRQELDHWTTRLADDLGVAKNPYSQSAHGGTPGGINVPVVSS